MHNTTKIFIALAGTVLITACVNQNTLAQKKLAPVTNPCQKISALLKAYDTGFEEIKLSKIQSKASNTWKAKYNLVGENCHIWSWGGEQTTYACNFSATDEKTALGYYQKSISTTSQCLNEEWLSDEAPRSNDTGMKTTFTNPAYKASISTHFVPLDSAFNKKWTVYYYIGKPQL